MNTQFALCMPYPKVTGQISQRELETLYDLAAGRFSEMTSLCTYIYQSAITVENEQVCRVMENIAKVEMLHYKLLCDAIFALGGDPVYAGRYNYFSGSYVDYEKKIESFIQYNIDAELHAVKSYKDAAKQTSNQSLCDLYIRLSMDEELHVEILYNLLQEFSV